MPSVTYMNQSAPFWDFIANLEQQGANASQNSNHQDNPNRDEDHIHTNDADFPNPFDRQGMLGASDFFAGRGFAYRGPPAHHRQHEQNEESHEGEKEAGKETSKDNNNNNNNEKNDEEMRDGEDNGEGPSGNSASDTEGCCAGRRGRHGRCGGPRRRHCGPRGPGGFGGPWGRGPPHHGPPFHGPPGGPSCVLPEGFGGHHGGPPFAHHGGPRHGHHQGPHHGPRGFGRRGGWGPWGRGGFFGGGGVGGDFDPTVLMKQFWKQFTESQETTQAAADTEDHVPDADVFDTEHAFVVHVSLPGAKKEDVGVNWNAEQSELSIAGVIYRPGDEQFLQALAMNERKVGPFERKIRLGTRATPAHIDADSITAKLEDGILRVEVPKLDTGYVEIRKVDIQ